MKKTSTTTTTTTVAEVVPLKQGLKRRKSHMDMVANMTCCRGSSIKTRIETFQL